MADIVYRLPNYITFLRLALIPLFVVLLIDPSRPMINAACVIFIFAAFTDYIDGWIARRWGAVSDFGKIFDPLADKILVISALVMLTSLRSDLYSEPWVPGWMVVMVLAREIWITGMRTWAASKGVVVAAGSVGKVKSFFQMLAIVCLLLHDYTLTVMGLQLSYQFIGINLLALSLAFSYISAFYYTYDILAPDSIYYNSAAKTDVAVEKVNIPTDSKLN